MKKIGFLGVFLLISTSAYSQNSFPGSGNLGIGTNAPQSTLNIKKSEIGYDFISIVRNSESPNLDLISSFDGNDDLQSGSFAFGARPVDDCWQIWSKRATSNWTNLFSVGVDGNVGIGITTGHEKLSVNGNIRAKEIKVETANWPDSVFEPNYKITPLPDLERYIRTNKHLPGMPSAKEIEGNGLELGKIVQNQQKTIEELTLHLIQQQKQIDELKRHVAAR